MLFKLLLDGLLKGTDFVYEFLADNDKSSS